MTSEESCAIRVETEEQLKEIRDKHPGNVTAYLSDQCGHCAEIKPVIEKECMKTNNLTPFPVIPTVICPVDKDFCVGELQSVFMSNYMKETGKKKIKTKDLKKLKMGVPLMVGQLNGNQVFQVSGNKPSAVSNNYSIFRDIINETKSKMEMKKNVQ